MLTSQQNDSSMQPDTVAVVVTYNPSLDGLQRLLSAVSAQVAAVLVIDNGSAQAQSIQRLVSQLPNGSFNALPKNMGIAYAQNVGIREAHKRRAAYVLTLDQDSVPTSGMVRTLAEVLAGSRSEEPIAAVGPLLRDESTQLPLPFFSYRDGHKKRITPAEGAQSLDIEFLVSSGTLLSMDALARVGLMREELFIGYVDVEWCLRARSLGYRILACCATTMNHNLGERRVKIGRWVIPMHSPWRHFHLMRSGIYMQRLPHVDKTWKRADRRQLARSFVLFSLAGLPRLEEFTSMCRGVSAGLRIPIGYAPALTLQDQESATAG